jgi:hypothetical protein
MTWEAATSFWSLPFCGIWFARTIEEESKLNVVRA